MLNTKLKKSISVGNILFKMKILLQNIYKHKLKNKHFSVDEHWLYFLYFQCTWREILKEVSFYHVTFLMIRIQVQQHLCWPPSRAFAGFSSWLPFLWVVLSLFQEEKAKSTKAAEGSNNNDGNQGQNSYLHVFYPVKGFF